MKRKNIFILIAIVAVLALVGCSGKKETSGSSAESGSSEIMLAQAGGGTSNTGSSSITITGISGTLRGTFPDGNPFEVNLDNESYNDITITVSTSTKNFYDSWDDDDVVATGGNVGDGSASVKNGSVTISLEDDDYRPWAGSGSYYIQLEISNTYGYFNFGYAPNGNFAKFNMTSSNTIPFSSFKQIQ